MNSARYQNLMQYILPLMAVSSLISQSLVDLFLIICVGNWLYFFIKEKNRKEFLPYTGLEWAFGGLFLAMLLSVLVNYWGQWEYLWPVHKIKWVLEFYAMVWFLRRFGFNAEKTVKTILWVGMIPSIYAIATYFNGTDFLNPDRDTADRVVGLVNSSTYHAHAGAILLGLSLFYFVQNKMYKVRANWILAPLLFVFFCSFYLTYTRGAWLAFFAGVIVFVMLQGRKVFLIFVALMLLALPVTYTVGAQFKERIQQSVDPAKMDMGRIGLFKAYFKVFNENRLFGSGYDGYKRDQSLVPYAAAEGVVGDLQLSHAHNQYLQMAATTGVFGLIAFVAIFALLLIRAGKSVLSGDRQKMASFSVLSLVAVLFLTDQSFEYAKIKAVIVFSMALIYVFSEFSETKIKSRVG